MVLPVLQIVCEAACQENYGGFLWVHSSQERGEEMLRAEQGFSGGTWVGFEEWKGVNEGFLLRKEFVCFVRNYCAKLQFLSEGLRLSSFIWRVCGVVTSSSFLSPKTLWSIFSCRICATSMFKQVSNHGVLSCTCNVTCESSSEQAAASQL